MVFLWFSSHMRRMVGGLKFMGESKPCETETHVLSRLTLRTTSLSRQKGIAVTVVYAKTIQCGAPKIAKLVYNSNFTMVYGTYNL